MFLEGKTEQHYLSAVRRKVSTSQLLKVTNLCAHVSEVGPDPESVPTLSGPVSAWSSVPLRIRTSR